MNAVIETHGLGKSYRGKQALSELTLSVPAGTITGLVGPNGAGKSTFLNLVTGMLTPSAGTITVLGEAPAGTSRQLARVGYLAQDTPTYASLSIADHFRFGAHLNPAWDQDYARARIARLGLNPRQKAGKLSGGQRAQLALTMAIAKRPELLILDEPVAALDPLARRNFLAILAEAVAGGGVTAVVSSHLLADMERVSDHLVLLAESRVQLCDDIDTLLAEHRVLRGPRQSITAIEKTHTVVQAIHTDRQTTLLVRGNAPVLDPAWESDEVGLEEMVLAYMGQDAAPAESHLTVVGEEQ